MAFFVTIQTSSLSYGGEAVGEIVEGHAEMLGKKAFVPFAVPGERVRAEVIQNEPRRVHARLVEVLQASPDRIAPACPAFSRCGGCQLQHIALSRQRELKQQMVHSMLQRHAGVTPLEEISWLGADLSGEGYRSRIALHLGTDGALGFYRSGTGEIVSFEKCLIARDSLNQVLPILREQLPHFSKWIGKVSIEESRSGICATFVQREGAPLSRDNWKVLLSKFAPNLCEMTLEEAGARRFQWSKDQSTPTATGRFSQVNQAGNQLLITRTIAEMGTAKRVAEFYAGSGNFTFPLVDAGHQVEAVEVDPILVKLANDQLERRNIQKQVCFHNASTEQFLKRDWPRLSSAMDAVLLDPPRSGAQALAAALARSSISRILYVSCNLPSLTRDIKLLSPKYSLRRMYLVDMFPQTYHVETLSVLSRR